MIMIFDVGETEWQSQSCDSLPDFLYRGFILPIVLYDLDYVVIDLQSGEQRVVIGLFGRCINPGGYWEASCSHNAVSVSSKRNEGPELSYLTYNIVYYH